MANPLRLPDLAELEAGMAALRTAYPATIETTIVGASRSGRPIVMDSVGSGPRAALIVGGPHPNEPVGGATVMELARNLAGDAAMRDASGYRWHFISCIDPDGLALNASWLAGERGLTDYFSGFFRPAFEDQPEYSFPISANGYDFSASTIENRAWQRALDLTRPALQVSLHNADYGGGFYVTSRNIPQLTEALARQPAAHGLTLNPFGEPFSEMKAHGEGVFAFMDFQSLHSAIASVGGNVSDWWAAGESSAGYAAAKYGTFSMVCEVPLWEDGRLRNLAPSAFAMRDILEQQDMALQQMSNFLEAAKPAFANIDQAGDRGAVSSALEEYRRLAPRQIEHVAALKAAKDWSSPMSIRDHAIISTTLALAALRPYALALTLDRLCSRQDPVADLLAGIAAAARAHLARQLMEVQRAATFSAVPTARLMALQRDAILTTASMLA